MSSAATPTPSAESVGFIGLGHMGATFATRLLRAGQALHVHDLNTERVQLVAGAGGTPTADAASLVRASTVVFLSLPHSAAVEGLARATLVPEARAGVVFIDLGTTELEATRSIAAEAARRGAHWIDAPVSGDPSQPVYLFAGGDAAAFARVRPLLHVLADPEHCTHAGPSGAGQIVKGVNQLALGLIGAAWLETVSYGTRQGVDAALLERAVGGPSGWRAEFARAACAVAEGKGEAQDAKFAELPYFLRAAAASEITLPLTAELYRVCAGGEPRWRDNMNRPYVSFWHQLHHGKKPNGA